MDNAFLGGCRIAVAYSSVTGNTRRLAEALAAASGDVLLSLRDRPDLTQYDLLALGFWVRKGAPDELSQRAWTQLSGKYVYYFGTLGAWPWSDHAMRCRETASSLLVAGGNSVLDGFLCQGKVNPKIVEQTISRGTHPLTQKRQDRLDEAARHPNDEDLAAASRGWLLSRERGVNFVGHARQPFLSRESTEGLLQ